jgi:formylglycine-generating enzyme required for sulfatase activity
MKYFFFIMLLFGVSACHQPDKAKIEKLLEFVKVEGGTFTMGDPEIKDATPHEVELSTFYLQKTEVTQELYEAVTGTNPSENKEWKDNPVTHVSWDDAQSFVQKLNKVTGKKYRLPTEAEWEYAARGGNKSKHYKYAGAVSRGPAIPFDGKTPLGGNIPLSLDDVAWYKDNSNGNIHPVKEKKPNELGLYDMSGNVWEWCQDRYGDYRLKAQKDPKGPDGDGCKVIRGGSWNFNAWRCLVAYRDCRDPDIRFDDQGFRLLSPVE